ncbi:carph-isopro domain-containing protein, partial [Klebsiella pneumoniae]|uniref:carph-isopro domain-containing protein n=1 Tax=Klebsiella pneumoniae TaxID=573 RepID=UPI0035661B40
MSQIFSLDVRFAICKFSCMSAVAAIIDKLGGYAKVAAGIGQPPGTVAAWRHRASIPVKHWPALAAFAEQEGSKDASYGHLVSAHASDRTLPKDEQPRALS